MRASTPIDGMTTRTGVGSTCATGDACGPAATEGAGRTIWRGTAGGPKKPMTAYTPSATTRPPAAALSLPLTSAGILGGRTPQFRSLCGPENARGPGVATPRTAQFAVRRAG